MRYFDILILYANAAYNYQAYLSGFFILHENAAKASLVSYKTIPELWL
jgi:hypothetical protein